MTIENLDIIVCPLCKNELLIKKKNQINKQEEEAVFYCNVCDQSYPIIEGIPRMIVDKQEYIKDNILPANLKKFVVTPEKVQDLLKEDAYSNKSLSDSISIAIQHWSFKYIRIGYLIISLLLIFIGFFQWFSKSSLSIAFSCIGTALGIWIIDYFLYRIKHIRAYGANLKILKNIFGKNVRNLPLNELRPKEKKFVDDKQLNEDKDQTHLVNWKNHQIKNILKKIKIEGKIAANIGCGGYRHRMVSQAYFDFGFKMIGVDIREENIKEFSTFFNTEGILADASMLPLANDTFHVVNCTDVIEHHYNALLLADELGRILKKGGILILTTENSTSLGFFEKSLIACYSFNPIIFIERLIGTIYDAILPPNALLDTWHGMIFYHTHFSPKEIRNIIKRSGFDILQHNTAYPHSRLEWFNNVISKLPLVKYMGYSHLIIAKKV